MHFTTTALLSLLAAAATAAPTTSNNPNDPNFPQVKVTLRGANGTDAIAPFRVEPEVGGTESAWYFLNPVTATGARLDLGPRVENKALRCEVRDRKGKAIGAKRGKELDVSISAGEDWKFQKEMEVGLVVCDQAFKPISPNDPRLQVDIVLEMADRSGPHTVQMSGVKEVAHKIDSGALFERVSINRAEDSLVDMDLRCKLLNCDDEPIKVWQSGIEEVTFADRGKGAWVIQEPEKVAKIVCSPCFKPLQQ